MRVHQVVVAAAPADAVTNAAIEYRRLLRPRGPSDIFAAHVHDDLAGDVQPLHRFDEAGADLIVFHASIGSPEVFAFIRSRPEPVVLVYHNISPADAFAPYDPAFADLLSSGRRDVADLAGKAELRSMGHADVLMNPMVIDLARTTAIVPDPATTAAMEALDGPVLLYVGQLLPHKSVERLVQAFHVLSTYLSPDAHLLVVGERRSAPYRDRIETFVRELGLSRLHLLGPVSDEALVAHYRRADVFVTASSHEGVCVPLVEAMAFAVPVVARACAAVPETLGGAGVVLPGDAGARVFAEAVDRVLRDAPLREELVRRGAARASHFDADEARRTFLRHLDSLSPP
jgi:glycosyltransferase involved in cell wall biosynthesis